jgi:protein tyrosine phosphatase
MSPKVSYAVKYMKQLAKLKSKKPSKTLEEYLKKDFDQLSKESQKKEKPLNYTVAQAPENINKNRYFDVLALEETRVRLSISEPLNFSNNLQYSDDLSDFSQDDDDDDDVFSSPWGSDYINANLLTKGNTESAYIACQAPLPNTIPDFWKMVWEQHIAVIVMLTKLSERGKVKAHCYWPESIGYTSIHGNLTITLIEQQPAFQGTIVRLMKIQDKSEVRYVYHLHYCDWPDFGTPSSTQSIRTLLSMKDLIRSRAAQQGCRGPVIVHCSAGLGRAGTFVAADWLLQSVLGPKKTDEIQFTGNPRNRLSSVVSLLRDQRPGMIQTSEQYSFVMAVLYDTISSLQPWTRQN